MIQFIHRNKSCLVVIFFLMQAISYTANSQTNIAGGFVKGTWTLSNSPYYIDGEITIPDNETLEIKPGVKVIFTGHYKLNVQGRILAIGNKKNMISFTAQDSIQGWHGIRFNETKSTNDSSKILYCELSLGKALGIGNDDNCGGAIFIKNFDKIIIAHCSLLNNMTNGDQFTGGAAIFLANSSPRILGNFLSGNQAIGGHGGGICVFYEKSEPVILNNTICNNQAFGGGGIACYLCNPVIINNTIANNGMCDHGGGVDFIDSSPTLINTILFGNRASVGSQVHVGTFNGPTSEPNFLFCNIEGGKRSFARDHYPGGEFNGRYENTIDLDPMFIHSGNDDYHLSDSSPCIGIGVNAITISESIIAMPQIDFDGKNRPDPAGSKVDIGAFENRLGSSSKNIN